MDLSLKEKILVSFVAVVLVSAIGGSVWAAVAPKPNVSKQHTTQDSVKTRSEDSMPIAKDATEVKNAPDTPSDDPASPVVTLPVTSHPASPSRTTPPVTSRTQTVTAQTPAQSQPQSQAVSSCDETVKASYVSLYISQVNAENTAWGNQMAAWANSATGNGMPFSGYVQNMVAQNGPAHDARLAQLQSDYQQNLARIHCS